MMQYSMTYRLDSDFPWGYLRAKTLLEAMEKKAPASTLSLSSSFSKQKKASIVWIVSNCKADNYRHHYVKQLLRYIDIDIYGHCMNNKEWPAEISSTVELISHYQFYLAIENSNCKDYVTEKLSNAYLAGSVPIVAGPSDYGPFIPNTHSIIKFDDFNHPSELADYINTLLANKTLYDTYLDYRKPGGLSDRFKQTLQQYEQGQCNLCQLAYTRHVDMETSYYPGKKIFLDNTCVRSKYYRFKYSNALRIYIPLLLLIAGLTRLFFILIKKRRTRFSKRDGDGGAASIGYKILNTSNK